MWVRRSDADVREYIYPRPSHLRAFIHNASRTLKWHIHSREKSATVTQRQKQFSRAAPLTRGRTAFIAPIISLSLHTYVTYVRVEREKIERIFFSSDIRVGRWLAGCPSRT